MIIVRSATRSKGYESVLNPAFFFNRRSRANISSVKMPFPLSSLLPGHLVNRVTPRPPPNPRSRPALFFSPGGHTHDRHTIPADRLHISLSDPVLLAAEKRLFSNVQGKKQLKRSIIKDAGTIKTTKPGYLVLQLDGGNLFQTLSACDDGVCAADTTTPPPKPTDTQGTNARLGGTTGVRGAVELGDKLLDPSDDHCDISEVMTIDIDDSFSNADDSAHDNSRYGSDLAPLASEMLKEELYARGYLKRPASRPSNVARKSRTSFMFASRNMFPKVLGRRQGRKVAECLRVGQDAVKTTVENTTSVASVTLRIPRIESPGTDTNTSASESFDLHEFSYITAFTTPPSSPSIVLSVKKGVRFDEASMRYDERLCK